MVLSESGERLAMNACALRDHRKGLTAKYCFDKDSPCCLRRIVRGGEGVGDRTHGCGRQLATGTDSTQLGLKARCVLGRSICLPRPMCCAGGDHVTLHPQNRSSGQGDGGASSLGIDLPAAPAPMRFACAA